MRWLALGLAATALLCAQTPSVRFRAGAVETDIAPRKLPIVVSGNFLPGLGSRVEGTMRARAIALDDGERRLIIATADSLMMPRELIDRVKYRAELLTGIPTRNMLVSATHTHSAPPVMGALGTDEDPEYTSLLEQQLVEAIGGAARKMVRAKLGWAVVKDWDHTHNRRWIRRSDKMLKDPFGELTVRANMHPGYQNADVVGPSGPVDPDLTVLSIQATDGKPIAVLANYSMHYVGAGRDLVSADYFGFFCRYLQELAGGGVAIMSQGTSGDLHWMDYGQPKKEVTAESFARELATAAAGALKTIAYREDVTLDVRQTTLTLSRRLPDRKRLEWAGGIRLANEFRAPKSQQEVYAREQMYLAATPARELILQAIRIGDLGIAAIPNEVYAITGLKLKAQSPLRHTLNIELANGAEGYIPPPEQHKLGGYTTWPARTAGLEVQAEPRIVQTLLTLLEQVAGAPRRKPSPPRSAYSDAVLAAKPYACWRLSEIQGSSAQDATGNGHHATYRDGIALYLEGPGFAEDSPNRAVHLAGGQITAVLPALSREYSVELWLYSAFGVNSTLFSRGADHLAIEGSKLAFASGPHKTQANGEVPLKQWAHLAMVRNKDSIRVYVDGEPIISGMAPQLEAGSEIALGDRFEGKLAEVSIWDRTLTADEIQKRFRTMPLQPRNAGN
jgi:hypothetical protein